MPAAGSTIQRASLETRVDRQMGCPVDSATICYDCMCVDEVINYLPMRAMERLAYKHRAEWADIWPSRSRDTAAAAQQGRLNLCS